LLFIDSLDAAYRNFQRLTVPYKFRQIFLMLYCTVLYKMYILGNSDRDRLREGQVVGGAGYRRDRLKDGQATGGAGCRRGRLYIRVQ
jgi:hypothetical protein